MAVRNYANVPATTLAIGVGTSTTIIQLAAGGSAGMPLPPFTLLLDRGTATEEVVLVTSSAGTDQYNVVRGFDNSTTYNHNAGAIVEHGVSAIDPREANQHVNATAGAHGISGSVVGTTDAQTLTNKTLGSGTVIQAGTTINSPGINNPLITGGTLQDSLVIKGNNSTSQDPLKIMSPTNTTQYGGVSREGKIQGTALWAVGTGAEAVSLLVKASSGQDASLVSYVNSVGTHVGEVTPTGKVGVGTDSANGIQHLVEASANTDVSQRIRRKTGQSGDLWQVTTEGNLLLASVDRNGQFYAPNVTPKEWDYLTLAGGLTLHDHLTRVRLVGDYVHVEGSIKRTNGAAMDGSTGFTLFTLPTVFRPGSPKKFSGQATLSGAGTAGTCRIEIETNGIVTFWSQESPVWVGVFGGFWIA